MSQLLLFYLPTKLFQQDNNFSLSYWFIQYKCQILDKLSPLNFHLINLFLNLNGNFNKVFQFLGPHIIFSLIIPFPSPKIFWACSCRDCHQMLLCSLWASLCFRNLLCYWEENKLCQATSLSFQIPWQKVTIAVRLAEILTTRPGAQPRWTVMEITWPPGATGVTVGKTVESTLMKPMIQIMVFYYLIVLV